MEQKHDILVYLSAMLDLSGGLIRSALNDMRKYVNFPPSQHVSMPNWVPCRRTGTPHSNRKLIIWCYANFFLNACELMRSVFLWCADTFSSFTFELTSDAPFEWVGSHRPDGSFSLKWIHSEWDELSGSCKQWQTNHNFIPQNYYKQFPFRIKHIVFKARGMIHSSVWPSMNNSRHFRTWYLKNFSPLRLNFIEKSIRHPARGQKWNNFESFHCLASCDHRFRYNRVTLFARPTPPRII